MNNLFIFNDPLTFTLTLIFTSPVVGAYLGVVLLVADVVRANLALMLIGSDDDDQDPPEEQRGV